MANYKTLILWQKAMQLVEIVYKLIATLPKNEQYALADQMRRSAISIPSNIAEGSARGSSKEYLHFLSIANGSVAELSTQIELCKRLGYCVSSEDAENLCDEVGKMLTSTIKTLRAKLNLPPSHYPLTPTH